MKAKLIIVVSLVLAGFSGIAMADDSSSEKSIMITKQVVAECNQETSSKENYAEEARRGCCSHHGGVCGCSGGRQVCCDGSYSPSCTCNKLEAPQPAI